ncbi:hypothetical protein GQ457_09G005160 [Hibiscus cannabinus]
MAEGEEDLPRDAKIVKSLLKSMGVEEYEPRVIHQFLELWYRYVVDVLTDSQAYSEHAGKQTIDCDDVKLAIQSKVSFSFSQPPPREVVLLENFVFFFSCLTSNSIVVIVYLVITCIVRVSCPLWDSQFSRISRFRYPEYLNLWRHTLMVVKP